MTVVFSFIAIVIGLLLVRQITRPLVTLTNAVSNIDETHLETDIQTGDDEAGRLGRAFSGMLARLKNYMTRLEAQTKELENKNRELERAHRQTRSLFEITRGIGALAGLNEICMYLSEQLHKITSCRNIVIILYPIQSDTPMIFANGSIRPINAAELENIARIITIDENAEESPEKNYRFFNNSGTTPFFEEFKNASRIAVFPFSHENRLAGALCTGCDDRCSCREADLQIIKIVLEQSRIPGCSWVHRRFWPHRMLLFTWIKPVVSWDRQLLKSQNCTTRQGSAWTGTSMRCRIISLLCLNFCIISFSRGHWLSVKTILKKKRLSNKQKLYLCRIICAHGYPNFAVKFAMPIYTHFIPGSQNTLTCSSGTHL